MKISRFLLTTSLCAVVAMPAFAEAKKFSDVDQDGNGELSRKELVAAFKNAGADSILLRSDMDGNGLVTIAEIKMSHDEDDEDDDDDDEPEDDDDSEDDSEDDDGDDDDDDGDSEDDDGDDGDDDDDDDDDS